MKHTEQRTGTQIETNVRGKRRNAALAFFMAVAAACLGGCGEKQPLRQESVTAAAESVTVAAESDAAGGESVSETESGMEGPEAVAVLESMEAANAAEGIEEPYLDGAVLKLLECADGSQNLSCVMQTTEGGVIVVDGGRDTDALHLAEIIGQYGGTVDAWLLTHPHSDHVGALTALLTMDPVPVEIRGIYYSFLDRDIYSQEESSRRESDLECLDAVLDALETVPQEKKHFVKRGSEIPVKDARITVLNDAFSCPQNTFNNSSVGYRVELGGKKLLFLGDMGWQAGENLLRVCTPQELEADVVQMAHHGQRGVERDVYEAISPEVCLWPTPGWLWDNEQDGVAGDGPYKTLEVRNWMAELGVRKNLCIKDGDQTLQ